MNTRLTPKIQRVSERFIRTTHEFSDWRGPAARRLAGTMQLLWGARSSRPPFSASRRKPFRSSAPHLIVLAESSYDWPARRRPGRPGRSRSQIHLNRSGLGKISSRVGFMSNLAVLCALCASARGSSVLAAQTTWSILGLKIGLDRSG